MISEEEILNAGILIVDDQAANVQLLEKMLRIVGYRCITSTMDPRTVSTLHRDNHYDLILLDLEMPEMNGFQVMEGLKEIETEGHAPILVISAHSIHKKWALLSGATDFISKPFELIEVMTRIHNMLEVWLLNKKLNHANQVLEKYNEMLETTLLKKNAELASLKQGDRQSHEPNKSTR